jgi:phospholipid/cholesterol/gamma-HCH transport system ATP-binding protein
MPDDLMLQCRNLNSGYSRDRPIVKNVDITMRRGEILTILGGSGSGKSTLLRTLAGLLKPLSGSVTLFGTDLHHADVEERGALLRRTGMLFQREALFGSLSVLDNVMFPVLELTNVLEPVARELACTKLAQLGIAELGARFPDQVSGGERKRVALARALVLDPLVVFCDEPTSGLDPATAALIDQKLTSIRDASGIAIAAVTHDIASVRAIADHVVVLSHGEVRAAGSVAEVESSTDHDVHALFHRGEPIERAGSKRTV